eukprot:scaffold19261_cov55-Phaeocystis_antarctica.AAC.2
MIKRAFWSFESQTLHSKLSSATRRRRPVRRRLLGVALGLGPKLVFELVHVAIERRVQVEVQLGERTRDLVDLEGARPRQADDAHDQLAERARHREVEGCAQQDATERAGAVRRCQHAQHLAVARRRVVGVGPERLGGGDVAQDVWEGSKRVEARSEQQRHEVAGKEGRLSEVLLGPRLDGLGQVSDRHLLRELCQLLNLSLSHASRRLLRRSERANKRCAWGREGQELRREAERQQET